MVSLPNDGENAEEKEDFSTVNTLKINSVQLSVEQMVSLLQRSIVILLQQNRGFTAVGKNTYG